MGCIWGIKMDHKKWIRENKPHIAFVFMLFHMFIEDKDCSYGGVFSPCMVYTQKGIPTVESGFKWAFFFVFLTCKIHSHNSYNMGVSKNWGIPKWMVFNGKPYEQMDDLRVPLFLETPIYSWFSAGLNMHKWLNMFQSWSHPTKLLFRKSGGQNIKISADG